MTDGEKIVHYIGMLICAERAVNNGAQFDILTNARKDTAAAIDAILNKKVEARQATIGPLWPYVYQEPTITRG